MKNESSVSLTSADIDRTMLLDDNFLLRVKNADLPCSRNALTPEQVGLSSADLIALFHSQCISRHLDFAARRLKQQGHGFYTIASCGHEVNAAVALAFRLTDMAFLHYRSAAFMVQRAKCLPEINIVRDLLLSLMASSDDPISGGRHKVLGSLALNIPPQTSTIASHLPKAVGAAASIKRAKLLKYNSLLPHDAVIVCSFGDASINHASALSALNAAQWMAHQHHPLPIVFVCEDNGLGISVPTPADWVETMMRSRTDLVYLSADGLDILDTYRQATEAARIARLQQRPVFLHYKCVRLLGHAGTDFELQYRALAEVVRDESNDPLLHTAALLQAHRIMDADDIVVLYEKVREEIDREITRVLQKPRLTSAEAVKASLIPPRRAVYPLAMPSEASRQQYFQEMFVKLNSPLNMSQQINAALTDLMLQYPQLLVFGEDVARKGGVYRVTMNLQKRFGQGRVFDTLLDETAILGYAIGHAQNGFLPIPEIQFLAYFHNAEDQLRGEAATLSFFSKGQFTNPMVLRIAGYGYQKGFGGHFHNDNSIAVLRDIPGVIVATPANGREAALMLRKCVELAYSEQRVVVFIEPIALYMEKDLHEKGDGLWASTYPDPVEKIEYQEIGVSGDADAPLALVSYGNGYYLAEKAAKILRERHKLTVKLINLRWLVPLNAVALASAVANCQRVVIVEECRRTGSLSELIVTELVERLQPTPALTRVTAEDCFIPLGEAANTLLPSVQSIVRAVTGH